MPRTRTYTDTGYLEVQWAKEVQRVDLVSAVVDPEGNVSETVHHFTHRGEVGLILRDLRRARKQSFPPFGGDAPIPVLDPDRIVKTGKVGKVRPAKVQYLDIT